MESRFYVVSVVREGETLFLGSRLGCGLGFGGSLRCGFGSGLGVRFGFRFVGSSLLAFDTYQLYGEDEGAERLDGALVLFAVSQFVGDEELPLAAYGHHGECLGPTLDDLVGTEGEGL